MEKYRPNTFCDLLTDEKINREILTWVKSWDEVVFGKKFILPQRVFKINKTKEIGGGLNKPNINFQNDYEFLQSKHKIILISGPPGIGKKIFLLNLLIFFTGKTTLAKVIAKHCGYESLIVKIIINLI